MRFVWVVLAGLVFSIGLARGANASVLIAVDKSEQLMRVFVEDDLIYVWPVSTGRDGYRTPPGSYQPYVLKRFHRSRKYDDAPMPYSIFYRGGYAIHGTSSIRRLGSPASHGCIRLHMANARELFDLVGYYGKDETRIVIRP
ncbi:MAG: L,D-transpeptidase [Rhodomicrobium sp.]|nr:L,D-transpeptidase [Rhodomicrobium sp.]